MSGDDDLSGKRRIGEGFAWELSGGFGLIRVYYFWYLCLVCSVLGEFPTEPVTSEAHPYPAQFVYFLQLYPRKFEMADRRDWGGGGDDPEESTQRMIERIWESLTDIRARMDHQAPVPPAAVPPVVGGPILEAPVPPPPGMELPFVPPLLPIRVMEEPVMQVEKFLRLQPPTYMGGPNPDTAEHWIHD
ncbi:hypothetical protein Taro_020740 [Colocasia esculenta]|uniref:Uncharacterized protein n=1 Tax=Colocasia esculenta TaxID=4460 RepID=A0A843V0G9_COLES|nr:hypothetical protein [Colocasia esculenta]